MHDDTDHTEPQAPGTKQILCMKWGDRYGAEYVNRLYGMVRRNITGDIRFICMTDDVSGIREEVETRDCPTIDIPAPHNNRGWRKVTLFNETLDDLQGDVLFLDLDLIITQSLDPLFELEGDFLIMPNPTQPGSGIGNTSVYRFRVGQHPHVLRDLLDVPETHIRANINSQTYISRALKGRMTFLPPEWCVSFKKQCIPPWPARYWKTPTPPDGARVVIFTGKPDPDEAAEGRWPAPPHKKLYKAIRPCPWIAEHWRP